MIEEGNRDFCYYNEFCYRLIVVVDFFFNFMFSNVFYVIYGIFLVLLFFFREVIIFEVNKFGYKYDVRGIYVKYFRLYDYFVVYVLVWVLVFEGLFLVIYYFCFFRFIF